MPPSHLQKTRPELAPLGRTSARSEDESPSQQTKTNESGRSAGAKAGLESEDSLPADNQRRGISPRALERPKQADLAFAAMITPRLGAKGRRRLRGGSRWLMWKGENCGCGLPTVFGRVAMSLREGSWWGPTTQSLVQSVLNLVKCAQGTVVPFAWAESCQP